MGDEKNDYDKIAEDLDGVLDKLRPTLGQLDGGSIAMSVQIPSVLFVEVMSELNRLRNWCQGLAESHRTYEEDVDEQAG